MSIQIVDNFQVNAGLPIDTRMVASGSVARDAIQYKYEGLRVFDLSDGVPYVWRNGAWLGENAAAIFGSGTSTFIPRFNSSNTITDSVICELFDSVNTNILIGYTSPIVQSNNPQPTARLQVKGHIRTESPYGFYGDGQNVTNISATNILTGTLNLQRLQITGNPGFILTQVSSQAIWTDPNTITVNRSNNARLTLDTSASLRYFIFYDGTSIATSDYKSLLTNTSKSLTFQPNTGNIGINLTPNTTVPTAALDINGQIKMRTGAVNKYLLMSDSTGLATWKSQAEVSVPVGAIIMWGGSAGSIPTNWVLCNGAQAPNTSLLYAQLIAQSNPFGATGKVPDLRDRFVVGSGTIYPVSAVGGSNTVTLTKSQIPKHTHKLDDGVDGSIFTESGLHNHKNGYTMNVMVEGGNVPKQSTYGTDGSNEIGRTNTAIITDAGSHRHTGNTGDGTADGLNGQSHENRPPYYALCYIIKIN
jgi:microcystin-dependent protein